ncbi:alpha/beta hydrolase [Methyloferula stellata]|uniref:alpha/beta hydrolase n=1 Tax=Methyloferula stellata TaxID=876270 RepID=UPI00035FE468|nr:dienelactone hydrolase family protein [Methyloferula stellata]
MASTLDGPRISAKNLTAKQLVVFLHGYGADGKDLIAIGKQWQNMMPDAAFVAPNAPEICAQSPMGRQWFKLETFEPEEQWQGVTQAGPLLDAFLDDELKRYGLDDSRLLLVGFSQGTMLALHVGLRRAKAPAGILGFSGAIVGPEFLSEAIAKTPAGRPPPILLVHGNQDEMIPVEALFLSAEELAKAGIPCEWHLSPGLGHNIDAGGLTHGGLFACKSLKIEIPKEAWLRR